MRKLMLRFLLSTLVGVLGGCDNNQDNIFPGYSYGDFVYISYAGSARIENVYVKKGAYIMPGQALVKMEDFDAKNILQRAEEKLLAENALLANLGAGERPEELNIVRSQLKKAQSLEIQTKRQLERYRNLYAKNAISTAEWDNIKDELAQKSAQVEELIHQIEARKLPARQHEINRQISQVAAAKLERDKALWDVDQTTLISPVNAVVFDIIYRAGERPASGSPIISLLPPDNIKVRFFIPEAKLANFQLGDRVNLLCDSCSQKIPATINYISPQVEFTPPVIYSTQRRETLIYMAEAIPAREDAGLLKLGQPFDVEMITDE